MKKQVICEYCGKVFDSNEYDKEHDYESQCAEHEISHLELDNKFKSNLTKALSIIDKKYESIFNILDINVAVCFDQCHGRNIIYISKIENTKTKNVITLQLRVCYDRKEEIPTENKIINTIISILSTPEINDKYEGKLECNYYFDRYEYMIGNICMGTIFEKFGGKKIRIEVID